MRFQLALNRALDAVRLTHKIPHFLRAPQIQPVEADTVNRIDNLTRANLHRKYDYPYAEGTSDNPGFVSVLASKAASCSSSGQVPVAFK